MLRQMTRLNSTLTTVQREIENAKKKWKSKIKRDEMLFPQTKNEIWISTKTQAEAEDNNNENVCNHN